MRKAGILMAVSSLPSSYGIGDFGDECIQFIDYIKACGFKIWQILPLNPVGYGNSPYQAYSSKAISDLYISLDELKKMGLIKKTKKMNAHRKSVDYEAVKSFKFSYYQEAFSNFKKNHEFKKFAEQKWVIDYAVFISLKKKNEMKIWYDWPIEEKNWIQDQRYDLSELKENIEFEIFLQFILYKQWQRIKKYANKKGIEIMGDLPIYVGIDSVDVWANQESFLLDEEGHPIFIAGVPPDYFSATGQRWGNPLYDWDYLKTHEFDFWVDRLAYNATLFDSIRIDHFRAFDTYWKIPKSCPTAIVGEWVEAPGYELFETLFERIPHLKIIAEDLGNLRHEVIELRDTFHLAGMKVTQFTFNPETPYANERQNVVAYTGTHDNQTLNSWFASQSSSFKRKSRIFLDTAGYHQDTMNDRLIAFTLNSLADTTIIPMQDLLHLSARSRMNTPGTSGSPNWEWKLADFDEFKRRIPYIAQMIKESKR